jgi:4-amino-4-deoxy-L-arabinose transferase-like glycosyltransferase
MRFVPLKTINRMVARWEDGLLDPARRGRTVLIALIVYWLIWAGYGTIAKSSQGLHPDMTEIVAWSRALSFGYLKHPPFAAWLARAWFSIFPLTEWSYYLLAMLMPVTTLWIVWRLSADYLDIEKRIFGLVLLTLIPFFNFHALKFNVNTVLMPLWAAAVFCFLRSYRTRSVVWATLTGVVSAACMLCKYWSVFLIAGLVVAALVDKRRAAYFRSRAPWITIGVGMLLLLPHVVWLMQHDFAPFSYAINTHAAESYSVTLVGALGYLGGSLAYIAVPLLVVLAVTQPELSTLVDTALPRDTERGLVAAAFWAPLLLPAIVVLPFSLEITSLWSMPAWTLLPVLLLSPIAIKISSISTRRILMAAAMVPAVCLMVAPAVAVADLWINPTLPSAQARLLATEVERFWHQMTPVPLRFVGGNPELTYGVITYAPERPLALLGAVQPTSEQLKQSGIAFVCLASEEDCKAKATATAQDVPGSRTFDSGIVRNFLHFPGKLQHYTIIVVPPRTETDKYLTH